MTRLALSNKRSYAVQHGYSLYVFTSSRAECLRRGSASVKLLALQALVQRGAHEWLFWLDPDAMIVDLSVTLSTIVGMHGGRVDGADSGGGVSSASYRAAKSQARIFVSSGAERDLSLSSVVLDGRAAWSSCLLAHAAAMRECVARGARLRPATAEVPALLAVLRPRQEYEHTCLQRHLPHMCSDSVATAARNGGASAASSFTRPPLPMYEPTPSEVRLAKMDLEGLRVLPRPVLNGEPASFHEGDFVMRIGGCIVGRRGRSLKWCEAAFSRVHNLSRSRGREAREGRTR